MDRYLGARWPKGFGPRSLGASIAALAAAALLSFHPFDPTATHLLTPSAGIRNVLGLPGALIGGTLIEWLGTSALLMPALILNWSLLRRGRPRAWRYVCHSLALLLIASALQGMAQGDPYPRVLGPGLLGWAGAQWVNATAGTPAGAALLALGLAFALSRIVYAIDWSARGREAAALARYAFGGGELRAERAAAGVVSGFFAVAMGIDRLLGALGGGLGAPLHGAASRVRAVFAFAGRPRLPRLRAPAPQTARRAGSSRGAAPPVFDPPVPAAADGFNAWFTTLAGDAAQATPAPQAQPGAPTGTGESARPAPPAGVELPPVPIDWEKQFRTYSENLDLDWEERVLKTNRARHDLLKWDEEEDDQQDTG